MSSIDLAREAFNSKQALTLTKITQKQLVYWDSSGLVKPSISQASGRGSRRLYSYMDLLALLTVKNLKSEGFSLQKIRRCVGYLRRALPDISRPLSFWTLISCGRTIYLARDQATYVDTLKRPGQTALRQIIDIAAFDRVLRERVVRLVRKRVEEVTVGHYAYQVEIEPDEDGGYVAEVAGLPGCITQGDTYAETLVNVEDAIETYLGAVEDLRQRGVRLPIRRKKRRRRVTA